MEAEREFCHKKSHTVPVVTALQSLLDMDEDELAWFVLKWKMSQVLRTVQVTGFRKGKFNWLGDWTYVNFTAPNFNHHVKHIS